MADLLRRVAEEREPTAFRELYQTYGPRVKAYMMRQGADAATADDLVQETLLTVWRKAALYADDRGSVATWVFTIARNLRIDRLRREVPWLELPEGRLEEALVIQQKVTASYQRRLGPNHPSTLNVARNIALTLADQKRYAEAERAFLGTAGRRPAMADRKVSL